MVNILVTGGCGFIGSNLVDELIKLEYKVHVIDDLSTGLKENCNNSANYYFIDILDFLHSTKELKKILEENSCDVLYHLAALVDVRKTIDDPLLAYNINSLATHVLSEISIEFGIKKIIFASTSAVYGEPNYFPVNEEHETSPISPYGLSKLCAEQSLKYLSKLKKLDVFVFRLPNVYGPRQRPDLEGGVISIFYEKMKKRQPVSFFGDGQQTRDWVHVSDIVEALTLALSKNGLGYQLISLGSGKASSLIELYNYMSNELNYDLDPIIGEPREGDIKHMVMLANRAKRIIDWKAKIGLKMGIRMLA